jgi:hypothetical protein
MKIIYVVTYAICELSISCGVIGSFSSLYAAEKIKKQAELALKNSGLSGTIGLSACEFPGVAVDLSKFFEEY